MKLLTGKIPGGCGFKSHLAHSTRLEDDNMRRGELLGIPIGIEITLSYLLEVVNNPLFKHKTMVPFYTESGEVYSIGKRQLTDLHSASIQNGLSASDYVIFYIEWNGKRADFNGPYNIFGKGYEGKWWAWTRKKDSERVF